MKSPSLIVRRFNMWSQTKQSSPVSQKKLSCRILSTPLFFPVMCSEELSISSGTKRLALSIFCVHRISLLLHTTTVLWNCYPVIFRRFFRKNFLKQRCKQTHHTLERMHEHILSSAEFKCHLLGNGKSIQTVFF